jgi:hypothetical protein
MAKLLYPLALIIMASIDLEILESAYKDGAFKTPPNPLQNAYFRASVITAWEVIDIIQSRAELGIGGETIAVEMGINHNTVKVFLRWLLEKEIIEEQIVKNDPLPMPRIYRIKGV